LPGEPEGTNAGPTTDDHPGRGPACGHPWGTQRCTVESQQPSVVMTASEGLRWKHRLDDEGRGGRGRGDSSPPNLSTGAGGARHCIDARRDVLANSGSPVALGTVRAMAVQAPARDDLRQAAREGTVKTQPYRVITATRA
jgi:hypothetical protein